ncbi:TPA: hypothetical protein MIM75_23705 [Klebsiella variicola]|nr:hypothetical protein A8A10_21935 [Klebsiella pneumoniae]HBX9967577.1 hypothetical protein [Klebsiella variicola]HBX9972883.1 hypothetical protein [Klebsiella variicola]
MNIEYKLFRQRVKIFKSSVIFMLLRFEVTNLMIKDAKKPAFNLLSNSILICHKIKNRCSGS